MLCPVAFSFLGDVEVHPRGRGQPYHLSASISPSGMPEFKIQSLALDCNSLLALHTLGGTDYGSGRKGWGSWETQIEFQHLASALALAGI